MMFLEMSLNSQENMRASLFLNKVADTRTATLAEEKLIKRYKFFPVNFAKFLRTPFLQNTVRLLLDF